MSCAATMMCRGLDGVNAMREREAGEVSVQQRNHATDVRYADPDGQIFGSVGHEQTYSFAGDEPLF